MYIVGIIFIFILLTILYKFLIFGASILFPIILVCIGLSYIRYLYHQAKSKNTLNLLTSKRVLEQLQPADQKRLARLVEIYLSTPRYFKRNLKDFLTYMGIGYAVGEMGFDRAMRVGIGYTLVRKLLKKNVSRVLDGDD